MPNCILKCRKAYFIPLATFSSDRSAIVQQRELFYTDKKTKTTVYLATNVQRSINIHTITEKRVEYSYTFNRGVALLFSSFLVAHTQKKKKKKKWVEELTVRKRLLQKGRVGLVAVSQRHAQAHDDGQKKFMYIAIANE